MPRLKYPSQMPPGGYQFRQIEIGWKAPFPMSEGIDVLAARIRNLRLNNPVLVRLQLPTNEAIIKEEIISFLCALHPEVCISEQQVEQSFRRVTGPAKAVSCCGGGR